jgi:hypothetical protein
MPITLARPQLVRSAHWLLDLTIGGTVYRFADEGLIVAAGALTYRYLAGVGGLRVELGAPGLSVAIELDPGAGGATWAELIARGADLEAGSAQLRYWTEGMDYAEALMVAAGPVVAPEYGGADESLAFSIEGKRYDSTATIPPQGASINEQTWPITTSPFALQPDPQVIGAAYPWIYGRPGRDGISVWGRWSFAAPASPAYVGEWGDGAHTINDSKLVIAGHPVVAGTVLVTDTSGGYAPGPRPSTPPTVSSTLTVELATDGQGRQVSIVQRADGDALRIIAGNEYWIGWTSGGGRVDPITGGELRGAGAVIEDLLLSAGVPYDRGRMSAARAELDAIALDAAITEPTTPQDWIESSIGGLVDLVRQESSDGVWYELRRWHGLAVDAALFLSADTASGGRLRVQRTSRVGLTGRDAVENDMLLRYRKCRQGFARTLRMYGAMDPAIGDYEAASQLAAVSELRYGRRPVEIETAIIADDSAAARVLTLRMQARAIVRRRFTVSGPIELLRAGLNSIVLYSEAVLGLSDAVALVTGMQVGLTECVAELVLLDEPLDRGRA